MSSSNPSNGSHEFQNTYGTVGGLDASLSKTYNYTTKTHTTDPFTSEPCFTEDITSQSGKEHVLNIQSLLLDELHEPQTVVMSSLKSSGKKSTSHKNNLSLHGNTIISNTSS